MDATRVRRTRDRVRQLWYARQRQRRFARFLGFANEGPADRSPSARSTAVLLRRFLLEPLEAIRRESDDPVGQDRRSLISGQPYNDV
jgi:hypothetical protein